MRLTTLSRSAVAAGLAALAEAKVIRIGDDSDARFRGTVVVPEVDELKDHALFEVQQREIRPLVAVRAEDQLPEQKSPKSFSNMHPDE